MAMMACGERLRCAKRYRAEDDNGSESGLDDAEHGFGSCVAPRQNKRVTQMITERGIEKWCESRFGRYLGLVLALV
jgi:hypothetical protein